MQMISSDELSGAGEIHLSMFLLTSHQKSDPFYPSPRMKCPLDCPEKAEVRFVFILLSSILEAPFALYTIVGSQANSYVEISSILWTLQEFNLQFLSTRCFFFFLFLKFKVGNLIYVTWNDIFILVFAITLSNLLRKMCAHIYYYIIMSFGERELNGLINWSSFIGLKIDG